MRRSSRTQAARRAVVKPPRASTRGQRVGVAGARADTAASRAVDVGLRPVRPAQSAAPRGASAQRSTSRGVASAVGGGAGALDQPQRQGRLHVGQA